MFKGCLRFLVVLGLAASTLAGAAPPHRPDALTGVERRVLETVWGGGQAVVIFDLDDTLINTRERTLRILRDFAAQGDVQARYPWESGRASELETGDVRYDLADTLRGAGIEDDDFIQAAAAFWPARFFSDAYCAADTPNPGAVAFVSRLYDEGATIVYLTGRDRPRMGRGTQESLEHLGFPAGLERTVLVMKPSPQGDDLEFKVSQFPSLSGLGEVVAAFENEPANINAFANAFPGALMLFLDTIHSAKPDVPRPDVYWVRDFTGGR